MASSANASANQPNRLRNEFAALGDDVALRRRNLENLAASLTPEEARSLSDMLARRLKKDIYRGLPPELQVMVARHFDGVDVASVLNVSKCWRHLLDRGAVFKMLANRWLPGFVDYYAAKKQLNSVKEDVPKLFYEAARFLRYRCLGQFARCKFIAKQGQGREDWAGRCDYEAGKAAWQTELMPLVVDDVRTDTRSVYSSLSPRAVLTGERCSLASVGDKLVVAAAGRAIHAFEHETGERRQVSLPMVAHHIHVHRHRVYLLNHSQLVFWVWDFRFSRLKTVEFRNHLRDVKLSRYHDDSFLFHPLQDNIFFVALVPLLDAIPCCIVVLKYIDDTHSDTICFSLEESGLGWTQVRFEQNPARSNDYGLYRLAFLKQKSKLLTPGLSSSVSMGRRAAAVFFNTVKSCFSWEVYPLTDDMTMEHTSDSRKYLDVFAPSDSRFYSKAMVRTYQTTQGYGEHVSDQSMFADEAPLQSDVYVDGVRALDFRTEGIFVGEFGKPPKKKVQNEELSERVMG